MENFGPLEHGRALTRPPPTLIVVDDDAAVRNSLKFVFELDGFAVWLYASANALLLEPNMPSSGCLLIDHYLPDMNGLELLAELRRRKVALPALLITGHPSVALRRRAAEAGVRLVEKPLFDDGLAEIVREVLQT